jgi:hypothetical protein
MSIVLPLLLLQGREAQNAHAGDPDDADDADHVHVAGANVSDLYSLLILRNYLTGLQRNTAGPLPN